MGFLDKIKDLFSDEEEVVETKEIEVEEKEEHKLPTFMRNKIEEEEKREEVKKTRTGVSDEIISDREIVKTRTNNNFAFPIEMDEPDTFEVPKYSNQNILAKKKEEEKKVSTLYSKKEEPKPKRFKPTPVISPVYGVLDKNYTKDEVKLQDESSYEIPRASKKIDFETVRNKAYGSLTDDIRNNLCENCELYQEVKITKNADKKKVIDDSNLLVDMTEDTPSNKDVTLGDAEDNYFDFGVSYEQPKREKTEVVINTNKVELDAGDSDIKIVNHNMEEASAEKIEVKEEVPKRKTPSKKLEDTIEFEKKLVHDEEGADEILNNYTSDNAIDSDNDIYNYYINDTYCIYNFEYYNEISKFIIDNMDDNFDINKDYGYISIYTHNGKNVFVTNKVDELNLLKSKYASLDTDVVIDGE